MMLPHGPDAQAFEGASRADLRPEKLSDTMAFMLETRFPQQLTEWAAREAPLQDDYAECWDGLVQALRRHARGAVVGARSGATRMGPASAVELTRARR